MIRFVRSFRVQPGKNIEARQWAKEIAQHGSRIVGSEIQTFEEVFGDAGTISWVGDYPDLAALERVLQQVQEDQQLQAVVARGAGLVVGGTTRDRVLRPI